jgi:flagellar assembly factor FliW
MCELEGVKPQTVIALQKGLIGFLHNESCTHSKIHSHGCCLCSITLSSKPHSFTLCSWCSWPSLQNHVLHSLQSEQEITGLVDVLDVFNVSRSAEKRLVSA